MKRLLIAAALVAATGAIAQSAPADYAEIARLRDLNRGMQAVRPTPDGKHYTVLRDNAVPVSYTHLTLPTILLV